MNHARPASYVDTSEAVAATHRIVSEADVGSTAAALAASGHPMCVTDAQLDEPGPRILFANQAYLDLFCCDLGDVIGATPRLGQGPLTSRPVLNRIRNALEAGSSIRAQAINYRLTGEALRLRWSIDPVVDDNGTTERFVAVLADVTAEDRLRRRLMALDAITSSFRTIRQAPNSSQVGAAVVDALLPLVDELGSAAVSIDLSGESAEAFAHGRDEIIEERVSLPRVDVGPFGSIDVAIHPDAAPLYDHPACVAVAEQAAWSLAVLTGRDAAAKPAMIG